MVRTIALAVLAAVGVYSSSSAFGKNAADCPPLPSESGFEWDYQPGPDFHLCYANPTNGARSSFGMYFGFAPRLFPSGNVPSHVGKVGKVAVTWSSMKLDDARSPLAFQALLRTSESVFQNAQVHVWILAKSPDELERIEALLRDMNVEPAF